MARRAAIASVALLGGADDQEHLVLAQTGLNTQKLGVPTEFYVRTPGAGKAPGAATSLWPAP